jgi:hypothetical protein
MRLLFVAVLLLAIGRLGVAGAAPTHLPNFRNGVSSTGWINFDFRDGKDIFIPATINGHETEVLLANGLPSSRSWRTTPSTQMVHMAITRY